MEMQVIGIRDDDFDFTIAFFSVIDNPQVAAIVPTATEDIEGLQAMFRCKFSSFLLVNDAGLAELRKRKVEIDLLGQFNSADITRRRIIAPPVD